MNIEIVSRGFETLLDGNSVVELERGCGMCSTVSGLGVEVRESPKLSLGVRPGPPELGRALVCMLIVLLDLYIHSPMPEIQRGRRQHTAQASSAEYPGLRRACML